MEKKEQQLILERDSEKRKRELDAEKNKRQLEKFTKKQHRFRNMLNNSQQFGGPVPVISSSPLPFNVMPFNATAEQVRLRFPILSVLEYTLFFFIPSFHFIVDYLGAIFSS